MQKAQCPVFAKGLRTVRYFHSQHFLYLPEFFSMVSIILFPSSPCQYIQAHGITAHEGSLQFTARFWKLCSFEQDNHVHQDRSR